MPELHETTMKTKFLFALILAVFFSISCILAQTYYYNAPATFVKSGYTYQCDHIPGGFVRLYNQANVFISDDELYKNGDSLSMETKRLRFDGELPVVNEENYRASLTKCMEIVVDVLTPNQIVGVPGQSLDVMVTVNTTTGKVMEVEFRFRKSRAFATVPVGQYREIEQRIKADSTILFSISDFGKQLNRIKLFATYKPQ
jgi:hypothetical protein